MCYVELIIFIDRIEFFFIIIVCVNLFYFVFIEWIFYLYMEMGYKLKKKIIWVIKKRGR